MKESVDQYLSTNRAGGSLDSEGSFRISLASARRKLSEFGQRETGAWTLLFARAYRQLECHEIEVETSADHWFLRVRNPRPIPPDFGRRLIKTQLSFLVYDLPSLYLPWARERGLPLPPSPRQDDKLRFTFPLDQDVFQLDPDVQRDYQRVKFRVAGGTPPYRWSIDEGNSAETVEGSLWWPLRSGTHRITVLDSTGNSQGISVSVVD